MKEMSGRQKSQQSPRPNSIYMVINVPVIFRMKIIDEREYTYWEWGGWSRWSDWDDYEPYDNGNDIDVDERTVYRYKEKG